MFVIVRGFSDIYGVGTRRTSVRGLKGFESLGDALETAPPSTLSYAGTFSYVVQAFNEAGFKVISLDSWSCIS